jgi:hypothetical protein
MGNFLTAPLTLGVAEMRRETTDLWAMRSPEDEVSGVFEGNPMVEET